MRRTKTGTIQPRQILNVDEICCQADSHIRTNPLPAGLSLSVVRDDGIPIKEKGKGWYVEKQDWYRLQIASHAEHEMKFELTTEWSEKEDE